MVGRGNVKRRWPAYLSLCSALLLPLLAVVWGRSHLDNDTIFRTGNGRAMALDCIRGELSFWVEPSTYAGPTRYDRQSVDAGYGMTAAELFAQRPPDRAWWFLGFGYAQTQWRPAEISDAASGTIRCVVVPIWGLMLAAGVLPSVRLARKMQWHQVRTAEPAVLCRRCGAEMAPAETKCSYCSFPAFVRKEIVA